MIARLNASGQGIGSHRCNRMSSLHCREQRIALFEVSRERERSANGVRATSAQARSQPMCFSRCADQQRGNQILVAISRRIQLFVVGDEAIPHGRATRDTMCSNLRWEYPSAIWSRAVLVSSSLFCLERSEQRGESQVTCTI